MIGGWPGMAHPILPPGGAAPTWITWPPPASLASPGPAAPPLTCANAGG